MIRSLVRVVALLAVPLCAQAQVAPEDFCPPDMAGAIDGTDLDAIGPAVAGSYTERAPGLGFATGVQENPVEITYDDTRNRLYMGAPGGPRVELRMVRDGAKPLRWDYRRGEPLDPDARATDLAPADHALTLGGCDFTVPPQFEWSFGRGGRTSAGIITFLTGQFAVGVKWNSARGARESLLSRL